MRVRYSLTSKLAVGALSLLIIAVLLLPFGPLPVTHDKRLAPCSTWLDLDGPERVAVLVWVTAFVAIVLRGLRNQASSRWSAITGVVLLSASVVTSEGWRNGGACYSRPALAGWFFFAAATMAMFLHHALQPISRAKPLETPAGAVGRVLNFYDRWTLPVLMSSLLVLYVVHRWTTMTYNPDHPSFVHGLARSAELYLGWAAALISPFALIAGLRWIVAHRPPAETCPAPQRASKSWQPVTFWAALVFVPLGAAIVLGFRAGNPTLIVKGNRRVTRIFEGFSFAGIDLPDNPHGIHVNRFLPYRLKAEPLPAHFVMGHQYFFHHLLPEDDGMRIAHEVLKPRLEADGFVLTGGANGIFFRGFTKFCFARGGGITVWAIQFKRDRCTGTIGYGSDFGIGNSLWPVVWATWDPADYILTVEGSCQI